MIDIGLLASIAIVLTVPAVFVRPWPPHALTAGLLDTTLGAAFIGVAAGRLAALAIDNPGSLTSLSDVLIIRSGVEFWPGVIAAVVWLAIRAKREDTPAAVRLAALVPAAMIAWACFEATCLLRDGCPGPASPVGLRPDGLVTRMLPIGLVVAGAAIVSAVLLDRWHRRGLPGPQVVALAAVAVSAIRSVASIWLPHIGEALTRQHRESIVAVVVSVGSFALLRTKARLTARAATIG